MKSWVELKVEDEYIHGAGYLVVDEDGDIYVTDEERGYVCVYSDDEGFVGARVRWPIGLRKFRGRIILEQ